MNAIPSVSTPTTDCLPTLPVKRSARRRIGPSIPNGATTAEFTGVPARLDGAMRPGRGRGPDRADPAPPADAAWPRPTHDLRSGETWLPARQADGNRIAPCDRVRSSYLPSAAPPLFRIR